jgi:hypothetical protein
MSASLTFCQQPWRLLALFFFALLTAAPTAQAQWAEALSGAPDARLWKTVIDPAGNLTVAGEFEGSLTIGTIPLISSGGRDLFVARRSAAGVWEWAVSAGGARAESLSGLGLLPNGGVVIVGQCCAASVSGSSSAQFGSFNLTPPQTTGQGYIAKLTSGGQWEWAMGLGALGATTISGVAVEPTNGDFLLSGAYAGSAVTIGSLVLPGFSSGYFVGRLTGWSVELGRAGKL